MQRTIKCILVRHLVFLEAREKILAAGQPQKDPAQILALRRDARLLLRQLGHHFCRLVFDFLPEFIIEGKFDLLLIDTAKYAIQTSRDDNIWIELDILPPRGHFLL